MTCTWSWRNKTGICKVVSCNKKEKNSCLQYFFKTSIRDGFKYSFQQFDFIYLKTSYVDYNNCWVLDCVLSRLTTYVYLCSPHICIKLAVHLTFLTILRVCGFSWTAYSNCPSVEYLVLICFLSTIIVNALKCIYSALIWFNNVLYVWTCIIRLIPIITYA